jgi:hypothetical protein
MLSADGSGGKAASVADCLERPKRAFALAFVVLRLFGRSEPAARAVSAYALQLDPPDFHAIVEVYLENRWWMIDPTRLAPIEGIIRIGSGRDAYRFSDVGQSNARSSGKPLRSRNLLGLDSLAGSQFGLMRDLMNAREGPRTSRIGRLAAVP